MAFSIQHLRRHMSLNWSGAETVSQDAPQITATPLLKNQSVLLQWGQCYCCCRVGTPLWGRLPDWRIEALQAHLQHRKQLIKCEARRRTFAIVDPCPSFFHFWNWQSANNFRQRSWGRCRRGLSKRQGSKQALGEGQRSNHAENQ